MKQDATIYSTGQQELVGSDTIKNLTEKGYNNQKEGHHYQASLLETSFVDACIEGKVEDLLEGMEKATNDMAIKLTRTGAAIETAAEVTGLTASEIKHLLQKESGK